MVIELDARVTELLCARLCHDLISPIAAINNGIELITELGEGLQDDAMDLIGDSARAASDRLQFFRVAFGSAQTAGGEGVGLGEARSRAITNLASERIAIHWSEPTTDEPLVTREGVKLALNLVLLATEILPGAGAVEVSFTPVEESLDVRVRAAKDGVKLGEELVAAITGTADIDILTPRTVQAYYTSVLARAVGTTIVVECSDSSVDLSCTIQVAG